MQLKYKSILIFTKQVKTQKTKTNYPYLSHLD